MTGRREEGGGRKPDAAEQLTARLRSFAVRTIRMSDSLPKGPASHVITHQIIRSSCSIGANYREAQRARSRSEFASKVNVSLQECDETGWWLGIISEAEMLPASRLAPLIGEQQELAVIFTAITRKTKRG